MLERRRYYRKKTNLPGAYVYSPAGGQQQKGSMTVTDISRAGVKFKVMVLPKFEIGATFYVEFHLDDKQQTLIKKEATAKMIADRLIGAEFCSIDPSDPSDKALGFYLF
jgi:c-di-GMP-binding flagellar brake protein YcgR